MITTKNLQKTYRTDEVETMALSGVNLDVETGDFVSIMGPSGCGKSTLLNILGLLDTPSDGAYRFADREVAALSERERATLRRGNVGFVFQSYNLIDELTVEENVELPLLYLDVGSDERKERVEAAMERVKMAHRRDHFPQQLSGGQQQRVAVARAVVAGPELILADEPTGNLDSANSEEIMDLLTELHSAGTTIVMVTHSPADAEYSDRTVHLFDGHIVSEDYMEERYAAPAA